MRAWLRVVRLLVQKEVEVLGSLLTDDRQSRDPFAAILGGAKVSDKIAVIEALSKRIDHLFVGGAMAYTFLKAQGVAVGSSRIEADKLELIRAGIVESLQIAVLATAAGIALSLPLGLAAARNLAPPWLSAAMRVVIAVCRSFHPVIVAILFVKAVGFGALAGVLALIVSTMRSLFVDTRYKLVEAAAASLAQGLLVQFPAVTSVDLRVRKLKPPIPERLSAVGIHLRLTRNT